MNLGDLYAAAFANTSAALLLLDKATGRVVEANPAFLRLCGRSRSEVIGRGFWTPPLVADAEAGGEIYRHLRAGGSVERVELPLETADGSCVLVELSGRERIPGIVQLDVEDVTGRQGARVAARIEAQRQLATRVAGEFTAMQQALQAAGELLTQCARRGQATYLESDEVQKAAGRAGAIARELLACGEQLTLEPSVVHLNEMVASMEPALRRLLGQDIELVLDLSPDVAPPVADLAQLRNAILKLASNSREAMNRGGSFRIETRNAEASDPALRLEGAGGSFVMLAVSDSGPGMDEESWEHLYEPFFTTKGQAKRGLGLAAVHGLIRQSGGRLWAHSEAGEGTSFRIYLPAPQAAPAGKPLAEPSAKAPAAPSAKAPAGRTILLMEKNDALRSVMSGILKKRGYRVVATGQPREALEFARKDGAPDLLIDAPGSELAPRLSNLRPGLRTLLVNGHASSSPGQVSLSKPFELDNLLSKVEELLRT